MHKNVINGKSLIAWFGYWPTFHDSEVIKIQFQRTPESNDDSAQIVIHAFEMTREIVDGYYVLKKHALVTFELSHLGRSELNGWNHQNALTGLYFEETAYGLLIAGTSSFGVDFKIEAKEISVRSIIPCDKNGIPIE
jgi:hypothetical protein